MNFDPKPLEHATFSERQERILDILQDAEQAASSGLPVDWVSLCGGDAELARDAEILARCSGEVEDRLVASLRDELPSCASLGMTFRIERLIAHGGQGNVYLAYDQMLKRNVAVKVSHWRDEETMLRLRKEAEIASRLEGPHVVPILGVGATEEGTPFLAMRYVPGTTLESVFDAAATDEANRSERQARLALSAFAATCRVLARAHGRGIIHCDVKPANILIGEDGESFLLDWGVAAPSERGSGSGVREPISQSAVLRSHARRVGTPGYFSPERFLPNAPIVPRIDIHSLGVILARFVRASQQAEGGAEMGDDSPNPRRFPFEATVERRLAILADAALDSDVDCRPLSAIALAEAAEQLLRLPSLCGRSDFGVS